MHLYFFSIWDVPMEASFDDFMKLDMRVGIIREVQDFPRARKPAYKVRVDFGTEVGEKWSSAQVTHYAKDALVGRAGDWQSTSRRRTRRLPIRMSDCRRARRGR
ncbi:MAG: hypothetical protein U0694_07120 [Anaerolineae bacterium]